MAGSQLFLLTKDLGKFGAVQHSPHCVQDMFSPFQHCYGFSDYCQPLSKDFSIKDITPLCLRFGRKLCFSTYSMDWPEEGRSRRAGLVWPEVNVFLFLSTLFLKWYLLLNPDHTILELALRPWVIQASHRTAWTFKPPVSEQKCAHYFGM